MQVEALCKGPIRNLNEARVFLKRIACLALMMIIGLNVEGFAYERQGLINELLKYDEEKLQSVSVPNSSDTDFDLNL